MNELLRQRIHPRPGAAVRSATTNTPLDASTVNGRRRFRIAFIGGRGVGGRYSGIETFYEEVGRRLAERGHHVTVYCRPHFTPQIEWFNGMRVVRLPAPRSKHLETLVHSLLSSLHTLGRGYDVIHLHAIGSAIFALGPRIAGCGTVLTVQGRDGLRPKWNAFARRCLAAAEWASIVFPHRTTAVSTDLARHYHDTYGRAVEVVPNGVTIRPRAEAKAILALGLIPQRYILFVGRLSEEKRCHHLIEAFQRTATEGFQLVFAGGAAYASEYEQSLRVAAGANVHFLGWVGQEVLAELYSNCALYVLPSSLEGLSLALLEAMSYGAPSLVSDIAPNKEAVGEAGWTFAQGSVDALSKCLARLLRDPAERQIRGSQARQRAMTHFSWETIVQQFEALYMSVAPKR